MSEILKLDDIIQKKYRTLSGGQKRRCEIVAALMNTPKLLFLDESTTGLDPATRLDVWKIKKSTAIIRHLSHYILLCIVMILCGKWFGWLDFDFGGIIMMAGSVAVVYLLTFCVYYIIDLKQAREINRKLKEKYNDGSESL